ncbi:MAG: flavodoxin family protein [Anaerolineae bacterium]|nr:flavodoxin family protein [Anaerolineae bacterium]
MHVLAILGSRNPQGQTARAVEALLEGYVAAGGTAERLFLPEMALERCRQCDERGWGPCRSGDPCVIEDDLDGIITKIRAADAVVFATPVYYGELSESMRALTDRLRRAADHMIDRSGIQDKLAVAVCVAGGGGGGAPNCCVSLERVLRFCGFDLVDVWPVRRQNLEAKRAQLRLAGGWLATL